MAILSCASIEDVWIEYISFFFYGLQKYSKFEVYYKLIYKKTKQKQMVTLLMLFERDMASTKQKIQSILKN